LKDIVQLYDVFIFIFKKMKNPNEQPLTKVGKGERNENFIGREPKCVLE